MSKTISKNIGTVTGVSAGNTNGKNNTLYSYCECGKRSYLELGKLRKEHKDSLTESNNLVFLSVKCPSCGVVAREDSVLM